MNTWRALAATTICCLSSVSACSSPEPSSAVLSNEYPEPSAAGLLSSTPVYKGWWMVAQFPEPVAAGAVSDPVRVVPGNDYGYALLAPGWDVASGAQPAALVPIRSTEKLAVGHGELLTFLVSADKTVGDCRAGKPLTQDEADYITSRIFAADFAGYHFDAERCATLPAEAGEGGASGAPGRL